jgi:cell division protein FtsN
MSKNSNRSGTSGNEFPVFAGILLGIVMGLAIAGVIAWFVLKKNPVPVPMTKEPVQAVKPASPPEKSLASKAAPAQTTSGSGDGKARFEFYKELTDTTPAKKTERQTAMQGKPATTTKPAETGTVYFLQEGAYTTPEDAEKVKAKLALLGMSANVQPANIPDKGVWYRVRLGPYKTAVEMNEALAALKLNGLNAAPIKAQ